MNQFQSINKIKSGFALAAVTAVSLSLVGGPTAFAMQSTKQDSAKSSQSTKQQDKESQAAIDFRRALDGLLKDHVTTNLTVNRSIAAGASDAEIAQGVAAQVENAEALSGAVASIYGTAAGEQFSEMFLEHIDESNKIAMAIADGDNEAKAEAIVELEEYLDELATFFSKAIPGLPYDAVYGLLLEHEELINGSTEAFVEDNFGQSRKIERQAIRQVSVISDALASGIIRTQPAKF